ncbi:caspase family protein [Psychrobacter sp. TB55-MNA-CIBAN-0194]|uniref:caspase family protein n=1 Tax=Psychrobacter sp. TB55-MNA-CIBAN-0194 TaxID=3140445 RepID=UPI00332F2193
MKLAVIIGVSEYQHCESLAACNNDIELIKNIFEKLDKFDDICVIDQSPKAFEAKAKLTEFINKYKNNEIEEFVFYYTGHGARYDDDFFYVFSDFKEKNKEATSLRNTELDGLIRNLNPELTVKIVDACYSGSTYVKSDSDIEPFLEKSAKDKGLKKLYFFHSSNSNETSLALHSYSCFTYSFCKSITKREGTIRYSDIMSSVADDMGSTGYPKPTFIVQADYVENFGKIGLELISYVKKMLGISDTFENDSFQPVKNDNADNSLLSLINQKSYEEYCTYEEASSNLEIIRDNLKNEFWSKDINTLFEVEQTEIENTRDIPNSVEIGIWINKQNNNSFFTKPLYETRKYFKDEYVEKPKKPSANRGVFATISHNLSAFGLDDTDYQLEKVEKNQQVISGFKYTEESPFRALKLLFVPKNLAIENYCVTLVVLFSRKSLAIFNSKECLPYKGFEDITDPECKNWKVELLMLKDVDSIVKHVDTLISNMSTYVIEDITRKLND